MTNKPERELENNDRLALVNEFKGKKFTDKMVNDFCIRFKIPVTDAGSVQDFIYQQEFDDRQLVVLPLILQEMAKMEYAGEYITEEERKRIMEANDLISANISVIIEDNGIEYGELSFLKSLAGDIAQTFQTADARLTNMCATVFAEMAMEKLGKPLTIKMLASERKQIADRKAKKIEAEKPTETKPVEEEKTANEIASEEVAGDSIPKQE